MSLLLFQVPRDKRQLSVNKVSDSQEDQDKRYGILKEHGENFTGCIYEKKGDGLGFSFLPPENKTKHHQRRLRKKAAVTCC